MEGRIPISLAIFFLSFFTFASAFEEHGTSRGKDGELDLDLDKRPYEPRKKPYHYVNEYKRLPLYNFGLGKRTPQYNSGLGKSYLEEEDIGADYDEYPFADDEEFAPELYFDDEIQSPEKRQGPYSFGLGKRLPQYDFGLGKRGGPYNFGLGKRRQRFNFGLGKRNGQYSFGLGKKSADPGPLGNRYSFGLGKRSVDVESEGERKKREISSKDSEEGNTGMDAEGNTHDMEKRSKSSPSNGFSRRFRKPFSYNFGLGKRRPLYDFGLGKRNYQTENSF